ncbi:MAG TPA: carbohydrate kinase family protein [Anaerolineales bacterium]|nr:carbohydrate kinase family protein [Anaerolineales bacterium]
MADYAIPNPESPVLLIGAAGVDILGRLRGELQDSSNPARIRFAYGGVVRNIAENLARLGQETVLLTAVGSDETGDGLLEDAAEAGVDTSRVLRVNDYPTGSYIGVVGPRGDIQLALDDMRIISQVTPEYLEENAALFKEASLLVVDTNLSKETLRKSFSLARSAHLPVIADPTSISLTQRLYPYLKRIFMVVPNELEAGLLCDRELSPGKRHQAMEAAQHLVALGVQIAIITMSKMGVVYATSTTSGHIRALRSEIVDPTGAGDALTAAVIFGLLNNFPLDDALHMGVSAASMALRYQGASIPDLSLDKLYEQLVI